MPQCGYCQSGQINDGYFFFRKKSKPIKRGIREAMSRNICRCALYNRIEKVVKKASKINFYEFNAFIKNVNNRIVTFFILNTEIG